MSFTEFRGVNVVILCLSALTALLWLRRATTDQRRQKRSDFRISLSWFTLFIASFVFIFIYPPSVQKVSWGLLWVCLAFPLSLGLAMNELSIAFRARNADDPRSPEDSDT